MDALFNKFLNNDKYQEGIGHIKKREAGNSASLFDPFLFILWSRCKFSGTLWVEPDLYILDTGIGYNLI